MTGHDREITIPGLNIQWPWAERIVSGAKTIETRTYPIPEHYLNRPIALIQTPARAARASSSNGKAATIIGIVIFSRSFRYESLADWLKDRARHLVAANDRQFSYQANSEKWGWEISAVVPLAVPCPAPRKRGIVYARECTVRVSANAMESLTQQAAQLAPFSEHSPKVGH
jgi:hypothetical protein